MQVTSNKMMKSVVVTVEYCRKLPKYHVWRRFQSKIMVGLVAVGVPDTDRLSSRRMIR